MSWIDFIGYTACASVFATFCMSEMVPLRVVAICSNVLFAAFGAMAHIHPVLVLHVVLLPVNVVRLVKALTPANEGFGTAITPFVIALRATKRQAGKGNIRWRDVKARVGAWRRRREVS